MPLMTPLRKRSTPSTRNLVKASELAWAVPQVVALRSVRMLTAGAQPSAGDQQEFFRMSAEKVDAFAEACNRLTTQAWTEQQRWAQLWWRQWVLACTQPWPFAQPGPLRQVSWQALSRQAQESLDNLAHSGLEPVHRRATANMRRLRRKHTTKR